MKFKELQNGKNAYYKDIKSMNDDYELYGYELKKLQTGRVAYVSDDYKNYGSIIFDGVNYIIKKIFLK